MNKRQIQARQVAGAEFLLEAEAVSLQDIENSRPRVPYVKDRDLVELR